MSKYSTFSVELSGALDAAQAVAAIPGRIVQLQARAISTMRRRLGPEAKRDIGAEYNLSPTRIDQGLTVRPTADGVSLVGRKRGINAIEFGAQWTKVRGDGMAATISKKRFRVSQLKSKLRGDNGLGARFAIKRGSAPSVHAGSFIARGTNGALLVLQENVNRPKVKYLKGRNAGRTKFPLESVYGPSLGQMLKHGRRPERLAEFAMRTLQAEIVRQLGSR
ncbi:hypothetical protein [Dyella japonica]|uniref:Uncharacterized protein n=1 Tax=Dyella japonica TaxID=231455 RepID=A0ABV2JVZ5_9GAMM